jgi:hypothetical protein
MKKLLFLSFCFLGLNLQAQVFDVDTLIWSGPTTNRVNIVILGDGYTSTQQGDFITDASAVANGMFSTTPYMEYQNYFNVFAVKVISNESGVTHPGNSSDNACGGQPVTDVDSYFKVSFDCGGGSYHRLTCVQNNAAVYAVLAANTPFYDQALVISNTGYYGGAGGTYATFTKHNSVIELALHETGHSFASLADEYWAGSQYATDSKRNMTSNDDISTVKWSEWVGTSNVGLYPHSGDPNWFKPQDGQCKMEYLGVGYPFCPVCRETHILRLMDLTEPYDNYTPNAISTVIAAGDLLFDFESVRPEPNTLRFTWNLNGTDVQLGVDDSLEVDYASLPAGNSTLTATILDTSAYIRDENHVMAHTHTIVWNIDKITGGIEVESGAYELEYALFPNPSSVSTFSFKAAGLKKPKVQVVDVNGKIVHVSPALSGEVYSVELNAETLKLVSGTYFIRVISDKVTLCNEKWIIQ